MSRAAHTKMRFHFTRDGEQWCCYDRQTDTIGYGPLPQHAYRNCLVELEMNTSDIHK